jgi:hypothetical protein
MQMVGPEDISNPTIQDIFTIGTPFLARDNNSTQTKLRR